MDSAVDIESVEYYAGLLFTDQELSVILEKDLNDLRVDIKEGKSDIARAILKGRFLRECRLRHAELTMAEAGSSPAQAAARGMLERMRSK